MICSTRARASSYPLWIQVETVVERSSKLATKSVGPLMSTVSGSRWKMLLVTMDGRETTVTIIKSRNKQKKTRILNKVCRRDHAAESTAPHGPPAAVPAAISAAALPPSTLAFTVAAAALAAASPAVPAAEAAPACLPPLQFFVRLAGSCPDHHPTVAGHRT